jgi:hypothetical protein
MSERSWEDVDHEEFKGRRPSLVIQQPSSLKYDLEEEHKRELEEEQRREHEPPARRLKPGEVHLRNLKDECPIKPVKDHLSRYADIILFLHEKRTPEQFALNGDEDTQEKAKVVKNYINWKANVVKRFFLVEAGTEHSNSQLRQLNGRGELFQVPFESEIKAICEQVHGSDPNHLKVQPMIDKLKELKLMWHNMKADVETSVRTCSNCIERKIAPEQRVRTNNTIRCKKPFERFQADCLTLKKTHGVQPPTKYLLVIVDYFSRFAWVVPLNRKLSSYVSERFNALLEELPQQPSIVQTDNGGEFSAAFDKLLLAESIEHRRSTPGRPQTNGAVERLNGTLSDRLKERYANSARDGRPWNFIFDLQEIVANYNDTVHRITGSKPKDLLTETDSDILKMVQQRVRRLRKVEDNVDDYEEGNPNMNLKLGDFVAIRNDIVQGARYWVQPKQRKLSAEQVVLYNIAAVVKMTHTTHAQVCVWPPPGLQFESRLINVAFTCLCIITDEKFTKLVKASS